MTPLTIIPPDGARTVAVVTGSRSEYGLLAPVMRAIHSNPSLFLQPVVTGMHLDARFGMTVREVENDWKVAARVEMHPTDEGRSSMARSVGKGISGLTQAFDRLDPSIVVVLGDRTEAFAAAVAASLSRRVLAHIHGGDTSRGGYDDYMRHAITKLAHIHFAATEKSAERIRKLGEREDTIFIVGAPGLDTILQSPRASLEETKRYLKTDLTKPYILLIQHPVSTHPERAESEIETTINVLRRLAMPVVASYPNSDPGSHAIIKVLEREAASNPGKFEVFKSLPRPIFLTLFSKAALLIGNSSCGLIESTSFKVPTVNIRPRQQGRECGENVLHADPERDSIYSAVQKALNDEMFHLRVIHATSPYGNGRASERIANHLAKLEITPDLFQKHLTYDKDSEY